MKLLRMTQVMMMLRMTTVMRMLLFDQGTRCSINQPRPEQRRRVPNPPVAVAARSIGVGRVVTFPLGLGQFRRLHFVIVWRGVAAAAPVLRQAGQLLLLLELLLLLNVAERNVVLVLLAQ